LTANDIIVAPSLLSADFTNLEQTIKEVEDGGADWHHVDVMDNHFVPNLAFSPDMQAFLKKVTHKEIDTHLMMTHPRSLIQSFIDAGSDRITIHLECEENVADTLKYIRSLSIKNGISIKPKTKVEALEPYLDKIDLVLIMTVEPGFGGQSFMGDMVEKLQWLDSHRKKNNLNYLIEVDGGINAQTGKLCVDAGTDVLVAGSYIYKAQDKSNVISSLKNLKRENIA
jgi:ribulose-phosphate 3-epimerase